MNNKDEITATDDNSDIWNNDADILHNDTESNHAKSDVEYECDKIQIKSCIVKYNVTCYICWTSYFNINDHTCHKKLITVRPVKI